MQESDLIQGLRAGDEKAFSELVALYKDRTYNTVLGFLQNDADAEDVTQEVFIKIFHSIGQFKGESKLSTWIYRITVTQALESVRRKKAQKRGGFLVSIFSKSADEWQQPDFHHPGVAAEQKEDAAVLFKAIRQLPEQQQTAFVLQKLECLSQLEIAEVMKTSTGAVESLLSRAKGNLRRLLDEYYSTTKKG